MDAQPARLTMKIGHKYILVVMVVTLLASAASVALVRHELRQDALREARSKAELLLERNLATHAYFAHYLKPSVFKALSGSVPEGYFDPAWMSSTYAVRGIDKLYKDISKSAYYYKECAINARYPANEADSQEAQYIKRLNADPKLKLESGIREMDGKPFFVVLRRGEVLEQSCLRCHATPQEAPAGLVAKYGAKRSFGRRAGEVVSAVSIRIPLAAAFAQADRFTLYMSTGLLLVLFALSLLLVMLNRALFLKPLQTIGGQAAALSQDPGTGGNPISEDLPGEWRGLAQDFNLLFSKLHGHQEKLSNKISLATRNLATTNAQLQKEIAERRRTEQVLRQSEEKLRGIFDTVNSGIILVDPEGVITFANRRMAEMFGYEPDEIIGSNYLELTDGSHSQQARRKMLDLMQGVTDGVSHERRYRRKNGTSFWGHLSGKRLHHQDGSFWALVGVIHDISETKEAAERLRESERLFRKVFDVLPIGLWIADQHGQLLRGNPAGIAIWGGSPLVAPQEYGVFKARRLPSGQEIAPDDWALAHTVNEGVTVQDEILEIDAFDGVTRTIVNYTAPVLDDDGRVQGAIVVNRDISEQRRAENEKQLMAEQLRQAQKMEAIGNLAGGIAHDFNNILSVIIGYTELTKEDLDEGSPHRANLESVLQSSLKARDLISQLLAFGRRQVRELKSFTFNHVVEANQSLVRRVIGEDVELHIDLAQDVSPVSADQNQIEQVLLNLVANARDAMPQGGHLSIQTGNVELDQTADLVDPQVDAGSYAMLAVSDTGEGMDQKTRKQIFEPFFTTKEVDKGTGLGLAMVYGIVRQHGGNIAVESQPGQGTTIKVFLPQSAGQAQSPQEQTPLAPAVGGRETLLLVEDETMVRDMARHALERLGYNVLEAAGGPEALELVRSHSGAIDLLVSDVIMPKMNGRELYQALRQLLPELKVLFISGYDANIVSRQGILEHGTNFLQKPFSMAALAHKVRQCLDA
ncbi:MAG: PAS domain S-box protein [Desulfarculaceae bacterium]|nr:PAS domain S-box protein [Desulfarculaceae bacterium]MCF8048407.1 PAS domain S-box protein [Desulfarculaceae bacterium]MCF8097105.1 PAS domain S-box protein [Desulfarculaceae bacterium]MCF8122708.1 PAS domain S-box protein [Desulfarculaceae bacterium]